MVGDSYIPEGVTFEVHPQNSYNDLFTFIRTAPNSYFDINDPIKKDVACLYAGDISHLGWKDSNGKNIDYNWQLAAHKSESYFYKRIDDTPIFQPIVDQVNGWKAQAKQEYAGNPEGYDKAEDRISNISKEAFSLASQRFVEVHEGNFMVYGVNAAPESVLRSTELFTAVLGKESGQINGIEISEYRAMLAEKGLTPSESKATDQKIQDAVYHKAVSNEYINKVGTEFHEFYSSIMIEYKPENTFLLKDKSQEVESESAKVDSAVKQDAAQSETQDYQAKTHQGYGY